MNLTSFLKKIRLLPNGKNNKFAYYTRSSLRSLVPDCLLKKEYHTLVDNWETRPDANYIRERVNYYNKCSVSTLDQHFPKRVRDVPNKGNVYQRDSYEILRYFDKNLPLATAFGDNTQIPQIPSICKSRPIQGNNENAVLLNMDKVRHFTFLNDSIPFEMKLGKAIWRGAVYQPQRIRFMEKFFGSALVNCGDVGHSPLRKEWICSPISLYDHLRYKFILALEGNDVASNLKWVMSSNSVAIMPKPKFETWFMEGRLIAGKHYIEIQDDYSDLEEKILYYSNHIDEAKAITQEANAWCRQFFDLKRERLIAILVMQKYFELISLNS